MGWQVRVLTTNGNGPEVLLVSTDSETKVENLSVRYCARTLADYLSLSFLINLPRYIRWADVICLSGVYCFSTWPTLILARLFRKPVVWLPHGSLMRWGRRGSNFRLKQLFERVCRLCWSRKTLMVCLSNLEKEQTHQVFPDLQCTVIQPAIKVKENRGRRSDLSEGTLRLLFVGRLDPVKGLDGLLEALKLVNRAAKESSKGPRARLTVAGSGADAYRSYIVKYADELGVSDDVEFVGSVPERALPELFQSHDVTIAPSHSENFCHVIAESISCGVPVIVSKGTPWQAVEQIGCGLCVENRPEDISEAIWKLHSLPRKEMGEKGREWIANRFTEALEQDKWCRVITEMVMQS